MRELSQQLLSLLVQRVGLWRDDQGRWRLCLVLDETLVEKSSRRMFGVACALTQLLTLCPVRGGLCQGILRPRPMPSRKPGTPISVHETQMLLRGACELETAFARGEQIRGHSA